ncbi:MAG: YwiC-like family protein [Chloroflexi bacterium]|nr:YwiC-like family protein [Chloroflexota bacterium]
MALKTLFRRNIALPSDHGAWVFLFSPLLIGCFLAGRFLPASWVLLAGALTAFLLRQPVSILVKIYSGRRARQDLPAAWLWSAVYGLAALAALAWLAALGHGYLTALALPGTIVFAWHLWLVSRRQERRQVGVDLFASGALALAAPAAYWVGLGEPAPLGWWLWLLAWLQSAASIVHAFMRLEQRAAQETPENTGAKRAGRRAVGYTGFNLLLAAGLSLRAGFPDALWLPYLLQFVETVYGVLRPATGLRPTQIGLRQLLVSSLFTLVFILVWRVG